MTTTPRRLEGKVALITGAAMGVGECTAKLFVEHGAKIVIADIQDQLGQAVCDAIGSSNSIYVHCDVTNENDVKNAVDIAVATYGKLDIMVNNAAIMHPNKSRIIDNEKTDFEHVLSVNVTGVFLGMKHAARVMVPARNGSIISMTSIASNIGGVAPHSYTCAKHAVVGLTKNLAVELGQFGIRVNCLSPYGVATPMAMNALGLDGEAVENTMNVHGNLKGITLKTDDVAKAAVFLASDEARYISGHNLFIDGISTRSISVSSALHGLEGKVAVITGAASGIGECTAKLFAEHGAKIVIADIQDQLGQAVCDAIGSSNSIYVHCDVTNEEDVKNVVDIAVATYGKLDIMFNNAAIVDSNKERIIDNEKTDFERVLNVNVTGVFLGMKHAARVMVPARTGSIISTASVCSAIAGAGSHAYTCAKHAVVGLTKNIAVELGQFGIRVNCLSPYGLATPMGTSFLKLEVEALENTMNSFGNLKGATLRTDDIAKAALFLVSDEAQYISGHNLLVDGGFTIVNPSFSMFKYPENP